MPDDVVIKVENLSKQYRIGAHEGYKTFRETLVDTVKVPFQRIKSAFGSVTNKTNRTNSTNETDLIWALKDVSFEVKQGEVVGIIGRNGAGKSTLLKILSRITEPTEGRVELKGRVGSLLEVGTGFHPELTGHENVYLYGAILGMDRWEVTRKFDEIVAFAEIEKFIETPVKRYSSGMYMRLAFAVAAHMETEILLVDEVLAVGDAAFQKKCLGKMGDIAKEGRTVLFVSHNMGAIQRLCQRSILLHMGGILFDGNTSEAVDVYYDSFRKKEDLVFNGTAVIKSIDVMINETSIADTILWKIEQPLKISITIDTIEPVYCPRVDIAFFRKDGLKLFAIQSDRNIDYFVHSPRCSWTMRFIISRVSLSPQTLYFDIGIRRHHTGYFAVWQQVCDIIVLANQSASQVTDDSILSPFIEVWVKDLEAQNRS